jgi:invasion protein IalB
MVVIRLVGAVGVAAAAAVWLAPLAGAQQTKAGKPAAAGMPAKSQSAKDGSASARSALAQAEEPTLLGTYGDWGAYAASPGGRKVCFVLAKPKSSQMNPPGGKRDPVYAFITSRPAENVKNEISVIIGYPFKQPSDATAEIGPGKFAMQTQSDGAWIKNTGEEQRMVEAMRKGSDMTVKGTSRRGTQTTDQFSLKGLSQALDRAEQECR